VNQSFFFHSLGFATSFQSDLLFASIQTGTSSSLQFAIEEFLGVTSGLLFSFASV
jgi:hypothetical protein